MRLIRGFVELGFDGASPAVTIGNFDGVHRGHQDVILSARDEARRRGVEAVVCTFDPHTMKILRPDSAPRLLQTLEQRLEAFSALEIDVTIVIPFDQVVARTGHRSFVDEFLVRQLHVGSLHVSTGFFFYALFGAVFLAIAWPAVDVLLGFIERMSETASGDLARPEVLADMRFLLRWGLVLFAVSNCIMPFTSVQTGLQRMGVTNAISVGASFVKIGATLYFLESGYGVRGLLYANALVLTAFGLASVTAALLLCPSLRISVFRISGSTFKRLFSFGWRTQVSRLSNLVMFETDVLVITFFLRDLELVGLYKIGIELANKARQVPSVLLTALVPAASGLDAADEQEKLQRLYVKSTKYVAALTVPLLAFVAGTAGLLMNAWQGTALELGVAVIVLRMMAFGYVANILPGPGVTVALGKGRRHRS